MCVTPTDVCACVHGNVITLYSNFKYIMHEFQANNLSTLFHFFLFSVLLLLRTPTLHLVSALRQTFHIFVCVCVWVGGWVGTCGCAVKLEFITSQATVKSEYTNEKITKHVLYTCLFEDSCSLQVTSYMSLQRNHMNGQQNQRSLAIL